MVSCDNIASSMPSADWADLRFRWVLVIRGMEMDVLESLERALE